MDLKARYFAGLLLSGDEVGFFMSNLLLVVDWTDSKIRCYSILGAGGRRRLHLNMTCIALEKSTNDREVWMPS